MKTHLLPAILAGFLTISRLDAQLALQEIGRTGTGAGINNREASGMVAYTNSTAGTQYDQQGRYLFICDDESNVIFRYDRTTLAAGVSQNPAYTFAIPLSGTLAGNQMDLEGGTLIPGIVTSVSGGAPAKRSFVLWTGSLSYNSTPERRQEREQLFLLEIVDDGVNPPTLKFPSGNATGNTATRYRYPDAGVLTLRDDLAGWDAANGHGLGANYFGFNTAPANLNIEGIDYDSVTRRLYLGFRTPLAGFGARYAVVVPVLNPLEIFGVGNLPVQAPVFGTPLLLDLGGRGIRDMCNGHIIGGPSGSPGPSPAEPASPNNFRLFKATGWSQAYGVVRTIEYLPALYIGGQNYFHAEALACDDGQISRETAGIIIACDDGDIAGSTNSRLSAFRTAYNFPPQTYYDYRTHNLALVNYFDYEHMPDPFGAGALVFHAQFRTGAAPLIEVSTNGGTTWSAAPAGTTWNASYPAGVTSLSYTLPVNSANRLTLVRGSIPDGAGTARFQNAVVVKAEAPGSYRSGLEGYMQIYYPTTGEASTGVSLYPDGNFRNYFEYLSGPSSAVSLYSRQGDLMYWSDDEGQALFTVGTLHAGIVTSPLVPTMGSACAPGQCGFQLLPTPGSPALSTRLGAMGIGSTAPRVGDRLDIYGDAATAGNTTYEYSGSAWVRIAPAFVTGIGQINLTTPDAAVVYTRSGKDPVTRVAFSSFWNE